MFGREVGGDGRPFALLPTHPKSGKLPEFLVLGFFVLLLRLTALGPVCFQHAAGHQTRFGDWRNLDSRHSVLSQNSTGRQARQTLSSLSSLSRDGDANSVLHLKFCLKNCNRNILCKLSQQFALLLQGLFCFCH